MVLEFYQGHYSENLRYYIGIFWIVTCGCIQKKLVVIEEILQLTVYKLQFIDLDQTITENTWNLIYNKLLLVHSFLLQLKVLSRACTGFCYQTVILDLRHGLVWFVLFNDT